MLSDRIAATTSIDGSPPRHAFVPPSSARCSIGATWRTIGTRTARLASRNGIFVHHQAVVPASTSGIRPEGVGHAGDDHRGRHVPEVHRHRDDVGGDRQLPRSARPGEPAVDGRGEGRRREGVGEAEQEQRGRRRVGRAVVESAVVEHHRRPRPDGDGGERQPPERGGEGGERPARREPAVLPGEPGHLEAEPADRPSSAGGRRARRRSGRPRRRRTGPASDRDEHARAGLGTSGR